MINLKISPLMAKKNSYVIMKSRAGRHFIAPSHAYKKWEKWKSLELLNTIQMPISQPCYCFFSFSFKGKRHADIDNLLTGLFDVLERARIFADDKYIIPITTIIEANPSAHTCYISIPETEGEKKQLLSQFFD